MDNLPTQVTFRFDAELNDFLPARWRGVAFAYGYKGAQSVKHLIEAIGVPHPEVEFILVDGRPVGFDYQPRDGEHIAVYPAAGELAREGLPALRPPPPGTDAPRCRSRAAPFPSPASRPAAQGGGPAPAPASASPPGCPISSWPCRSRNSTPHIPC